MSVKSDVSLAFRHTVVIIFDLDFSDFAVRLEKLLDLRQSCLGTQTCDKYSFRLSKLALRVCTLLLELVKSCSSKFMRFLLVFIRFRLRLFGLLVWLIFTNFNRLTLVVLTI